MGCNRFWSIVIVPLLVAAAARGDTTYTPPVRSQDGGVLGCRALNLTDTAVQVTAELHDGNGTVVETDTDSVPAGRSRLITSTTSQVFGAYCRFTFDPAASQVRTIVTLEDFGGSNTRLLYQATPVRPEPVQVATTFTPQVRNSQGGVLGCKVLNLSDTAVEVVSQLHDGNGGIADEQTQTVPPGLSRLLARSTDAVFGGYCRFAFEGNPDAVRGYISLEDGGGSTTRLLVPAEPLTTGPEPSTPTPTATTAGEGTPTATPIAGVCCGDCDGSGDVQINELVQAVNNALFGCAAE